ncbi:MAG: M48 family metalloprotease, partial [Bacteriovoracia bacterium]
MAKLFNGKSTIPEEAAVHLIGGSLLVNGRPFPLEEIMISFISEKELNLIIQDLNLELTTEDPDFQKIHNAFTEKKENTIKKGVTFAMMGFVGIVVLFFTVSFISERLPDKYFRLLVNEDFLVSLFPGTCPIDDELNKEIMASIGEDNLRFYLINIPSVNAIAYPFDQVFITHEMLQSLRNDHELFAVLGHEAGHLKLQHYKGQIGRMLFVDIVSSVLDRGQVGKIAETILLNSYSRQHEREADKYALNV